MLFTEVIKLKDGLFYNLEYHKVRVNKTCTAFGLPHIDLTQIEDAVSNNCTKGLYKCRVLYSDKIDNIEITPYTFRAIKTVELIEDNSIEYSFKYACRDRFNALKAASCSDEIIIVKNGFITDSSYTNLVFRQGNEYFTPKDPLLPGTKRESLLDAGIIKAKSIKIEELFEYNTIHFINAMIDLEDNITCNISSVKNNFTTTLGRVVQE